MNEYVDTFMQYDDQDEFLSADDFSKTQLKREAAAMHDLGLKLVKMGSNTLKQLPLDEELLTNIKLAQKIANKREGYRRQLQYLGKLLRQRDTDELLLAIDKIENRALYEAAHFHALEQWRDRILQQGDDGIQAFLDQYPHADRQQLRQWVRQAKKEQEQNKPPAAARALFKYIRGVAETAAS